MKKILLLLCPLLFIWQSFWYFIPQDYCKSKFYDYTRHNSRVYDKWDDVETLRLLENFYDKCIEFRNDWRMYWLPDEWYDREALEDNIRKYQDLAREQIQEEQRIETEERKNKNRTIVVTASDKVTVPFSNVPKPWPITVTTTKTLEKARIWFTAIEQYMRRKWIRNSDGLATLRWLLVDIKTDKNELRRALINLVDNAM